MNHKPSFSEISRRDFIESGSTLAAGVLVASALPFNRVMAATPLKAKNLMVGIQIPAASFMDEGVNQVLDTLQEKGQVNTLFISVFTYSGGAGGRQIQGFPYPGHGKKEDRFTFHGGNFATPHPEFYKDTVLKDTKAPDFGDADILKLVLPEAKKRGIKVIPYLYDIWRNDTPNINKLQEIDIEGKNAISCCAYNPDYRAFVSGLTRDLCTSYEIDGLIWGSEHQGPFNNVINGYFLREYGNIPTCFCQFHRKAAENSGINFERTVAGYKNLMDFTKKAMAGTRPVDGYFVEFWRIIMDYPEILAYEKLWTEGHNSTYENIYKTAKSVRASVQVGIHIWHNNSFHPFYRAEQDYNKFTAYADFLKPALYNVSGGGRYALYINNIGNTIFKDIPKDELLRFNNHLLNYNDPMTIASLPKSILSPNDYIYQETKRAMDSVQGKCKIYPGIDAGIPQEKNNPTLPQHVYNATMAALKANPDGILFCRKYSEMTIENLEAGGRAIKEFKAANQ